MFGLDPAKRISKSAFRNTEFQNAPAVLGTADENCCPGTAGKTQEGNRALGALLKLKPDFAKRGRTLIQHYIKFDDILARVIQGLNKAGIDVA
jgi:hypothetical protein